MAIQDRSGNGIVLDVGDIGGMAQYSDLLARIAANELAIQDGTVLGRLKKKAEFLTDFMGTNIDQMIATASGTSAGVIASGGSSITSSGVGGVATGLTTTGQALLVTNPASFGLSGPGLLRMIAPVFFFPYAYTPTEDYWCRIGFMDAGSGAGGITDGIYFLYDGAVSPNWMCCCSKAGVETVVTTAVAAPTTSAPAMLRIEAQQNEAKFYVGAVLIATITTNVPSGGNYMGLGMSIAKRAGTTNQAMLMDFFYGSCEPVAQRFSAGAF